jgi:hypothetical protein
MSRPKPEDLTYVTKVGYPEVPKGPLQVLSSPKPQTGKAAS